MDKFLKTLLAVRTSLAHNFSASLSTLTGAHMTGSI